MTTEADNRFDSIESAHEYIAVLGQALDDTRRAIVEEIQLAQTARTARRLDALQIVDYKLDRLGHHLEASRRLLNDLRKLRRVMHDGVAAETMSTA